MKSNFRSHKERLKMYEDNKALPYYAVRKFRKGCIKDDDDLLAVAQVAMWDATERFDETLGCKFKTFAYDNMHGAMKHYLRDSSRLIRLPEAKQTGEYESIILPYEDELCNIPYKDDYMLNDLKNIIENAIYVRYLDYLPSLYLWAIDDYSQREVAEIRNIPQKTVEHHIQTIRSMLRDSEEVKEWAGV